MTDPDAAAPTGNALRDSSLDVVSTIAERRAAKARPIEGMAQRLSSTALALFEERGYDAVTVADVAAEAGVTSRTFFRYFPAKEMVLLDYEDQANERLVELIHSTAPGQSVFPVVRASLVAWFAELSPVLYEIRRLSMDSPQLSRALLLRSSVWQEHLAGALAARFDMDEQDSQIWAAILFALLRLTFVRYSTSSADLARGASVIADRFEVLVAPRTGA